MAKRGKDARPFCRVQRLAALSDVLVPALVSDPQHDLAEDLSSVLGLEPYGREQWGGDLPPRDVPGWKPIPVPWV